MTVDIGNTTVVLGLLTALGGGVTAFYKLFSRFEKLEEQAKRRKDDDEIILSSLLAILDGLHEQGCNNTVTAMRERLHGHILENR